MTIYHTCEYCDTFQKSRVRNIEKSKSGQVAVHTRFCSFKGEHVDVHGEPCYDFHPHPYIWCRKNQEFVHILACLNRQRKEDPCSKKCKQKKEVKDAIRGQDLSLLGKTSRLYLLKPKLKLRKKCNVDCKACQSS